MKRKVILASQSPRRKELLALCVDEFTIQAADVEEKEIEKRIMEADSTPVFLDKARLLVETLAYEKAARIQRANREALVIGADTIVVHEDAVLGKPRDEEDAYRMLRSYAGKTHWVLTGVSIQTEDRQETFATETKVHFFDWSPQMEAEMRAYIASGSPMDKAGAYGIQEKAGLWVSGIEGDYANVIGLPVAYLNQALHHFDKEASGHG